jgi:hypothetical protein
MRLLTIFAVFIYFNAYALNENRVGEDVLHANKSMQIFKGKAKKVWLCSNPHCSRRYKQEEPPSACIGCKGTEFSFYYVHE